MMPTTSLATVHDHHAPDLAISHQALDAFQFIVRPAQQSGFGVMMSPTGVDVGTSLGDHTQRRYRDR